ncbi:MAG: hypothetical protein MUC49_14040 [Raineya sp.]|jgi:hypothetical protein|nr:hypothetical protein [Raineya sp.]
MKSTFTFQMPEEIKNSLLALSARRKQEKKANASIKAIINEFVIKGLQAEEQETQKKVQPFCD